MVLAMLATHSGFIKQAVHSKESKSGPLETFLIRSTFGTSERYILFWELSPSDRVRGVHLANNYIEESTV